MDQLQGKCRVSRIKHGTRHYQWPPKTAEERGESEPQEVYSICQDVYEIYFTTQDPDYPLEYPYNREYLDRFIKLCKDNDRICMGTPEFQKPCDFDYNCDVMAATAKRPQSAFETNRWPYCRGAFDDSSRPCGWTEGAS